MTRVGVAAFSTVWRSAVANTAKVESKHEVSFGGPLARERHVETVRTDVVTGAGVEEHNRWRRGAIGSRSGHDAEQALVRTEVHWLLVVVSVESQSRDTLHAGVRLFRCGRLVPGIEPVHEGLEGVLGHLGKMRRQEHLRRASDRGLSTRHPSARRCARPRLRAAIVSLEQEHLGRRPTRILHERSIRMSESNGFVSHDVTFGVDDQLRLPPRPAR